MSCVRAGPGPDTPQPVSLAVRLTYHGGHGHHDRDLEQLLALTGCTHVKLELKDSYWIHLPD